MANILAGHTNSYHTHPLEPALAGIAGAGFDHVELSAVAGWTEHVPLGASDAQLREIRAMLEHYGLTPSCLSGHSDLTTADGLARGRQAADLCARLGLTILNTAIGGHAKVDEDQEAFMARIGDLADYCEERGVTVGLEVHGEIMATGIASIAVIEEIGRPNVKINYDTGNCVFYGATNAIDELREVVPYLCHVHLKDKAGARDAWNFPAIGEGDVDFARVARILREEGYRGPCSVEIEFTGEPWPPVEEVDRAMATSHRTLRRVGLP